MDFNEVLQNRLTKTELVLGNKEKEYAADDNRFHNFDVAARMDDTTPEKALKGMILKHVVSVWDLIRHPDEATVEMIDEKIGDTINYLILLEGILLRRVNDIHA